MSEIWKDIPGYDGDYQISNLGRVKSLKGKKPIIMKNQTGTTGRQRIDLNGGGVQTTIGIARLVAAAFISELSDTDDVGHKNDDQKDNRAENLVVVPDGQRNIRRVIQKTRDGEFVKTFESITLAAKSTGTSIGHISAVAKGKRKTAGGYRWEYNK